MGIAFNQASIGQAVFIMAIDAQTLNHVIAFGGDFPGPQKIFLSVVRQVAIAA